MKLYIASVFSVRMLPSHRNVAFTQLPTFDEVVTLISTFNNNGGEIENIQHERSAKHLEAMLADNGVILPKRVRRDIVWPEFEDKAALLIANEGKDKSFVYWLCTHIKD